MDAHQMIAIRLSSHRVTEKPMMLHTSAPQHGTVLSSQRALTLKYVQKSSTVNKDSSNICKKIIVLNQHHHSLIQRIFLKKLM